VVPSELKLTDEVGGSLAGSSVPVLFRLIVTAEKSTVAVFWILCPVTVKHKRKICVKSVIAGC